jgi:ATP-dependent Clp protease protease subunit
VHHTGNKLSVIERAMDRDNFMSAEQAQKFGLIDKIVKKNLNRKKEKKK